MVLEEEKLEQERLKEKRLMPISPPAIDPPLYEQGLYLVIEGSFRVQYEHEDEKGNASPTGKDDAASLGENEDIRTLTSKESKSTNQ